MHNKGILRAGKERNDEFYTQYSDIASELSHYADQLANKTIYCPCDSLGKSNFIQYFLDNFQNLALAKLIATSYNPKGPGELLVKDSQNLIRTRLLWDGDFRSVEVADLLKESDVIITNPPFSLFREFLDLLVTKKKRFLIVGNINALGYKELFPLFSTNKIHLGYNAGRRFFEVPFDSDFPDAITRIEGNKKLVIVQGIRWFTNLDVSKERKPIPLTKHYDPELYPRYDNYDGIDVSRVKKIPKDYSGAMGVPITFLDKYCPEQFKIVGFRLGNDGKDLSVSGKTPYLRILIKRK